MKKSNLTILFIGIFSLVFSQKKKYLNAEFQNQYKINSEKLNNILFKTKINEENKSLALKSLAGFAGNIPIFYQTEDSRSNSSSNITALQNGTLTALNGNLIDGTGINILVMDYGKIFEKHNEFGGSNPNPIRVTDKENGETSYYNHTTQVAGVIGASGVNATAKGVLSKVNFDSYTYLNTTAGTSFVKLNNANFNISNLSFGINLGWYKVTTPFSIYTSAGWYWIGNYDLNALDTYSGTYHEDDANFDKIVYSNQDKIIVKSTGNYFGIGPTATEAKFKWDTATQSYVPFGTSDVIPDKNCNNGYNCIGYGSLAKNIITVGAIKQLTTSGNIYTAPTDVVKWVNSSAGPRKDGAIKPDLCAVGESVFLANYTNATTYNAYTTGNGTSYAAPIISGISGALTQVNRVINNNNSLTFKADEMKALLTHTANEAGNPGPDVWYGWGLADATKAAQVIIDKKDSKVYFERNILNSGVSFTKDVKAKSSEPLKVTISWVDPAAVPFTNDNDMQNNHASRLINDLDVRIIDTVSNTIFYPWKLDINNPMANATTGDNLVDNVEQIVIDTPIAGRIYTVQVSNKGNLVDDLGNPSTQNYALIITGLDSNYLANSDISADKLVIVYPTKTSDIITILIPKGGKSIEIFDLTGKSILKTAAKSFQTIDVSNLAKGVYIVNVKTENGIVSNKIIKE